MDCAASLESVSINPVIHSSSHSAALSKSQPSPPHTWTLSNIVENPLRPEKPFRDYTAEEVIELAKHCSWPSLKYQEEEFKDHCTDWVKDIGRPLSPDEFEKLQVIVPQAQHSEVWRFVHKKVHLQFAIIADIRLGDLQLRRTALVIDSDRGHVVGLWRIENRNYFQRRAESGKIR